MRWAIIRNGIVENIIVWDGAAAFAGPDGAEMIECAEYVQIGWLYASGAFEAPAAPEEPPVA